jgi:hypothetical protein
MLTKDVRKSEALMQAMSDPRCDKAEILATLKELRDAIREETYNDVVDVLLREPREVPPGFKGPPVQLTFAERVLTDGMTLATRSSSVREYEVEYAPLKDRPGYIVCIGGAHGPGCRVCDSFRP